MQRAGLNEKGDCHGFCVKEQARRTTRANFPLRVRHPRPSARSHFHFISSRFVYWHGATPTTAMTHIAIQEALNGKVVDWMEKVSEEQYRGS